MYVDLNSFCTYLYFMSSQDFSIKINTKNNNFIKQLYDDDHNNSNYKNDELRLAKSTANITEKIWWHTWFELLQWKQQQLPEFNQQEHQQESMDAVKHLMLDFLSTAKSHELSSNFVNDQWLVFHLVGSSTGSNLCMLVTMEHLCRYSEPHPHCIYTYPVESRVWPMLMTMIHNYNIFSRSIAWQGCWTSEKNEKNGLY